MLFHDGNAWVKKEGNPLFDATMGSYDGVEVCELVGLYLLGKLAPLIGTKNVGLYRDDGLAVIHQANGPKKDRIRKDIIALFKSERLSITINTNLIETDFLDVSLNLEMDKFFPYKQGSNTLLYIHSESNHPPSIIKQLPSMTNIRISNLSYNEHEFNKAKPIYESALKSSGFNNSMKFEAPVENARRNRNRKVIWFNPPYSLNVKTNIGKIFLKLVSKHFPRSHKLSKIFNLNIIKISYSSIPSVKNLIKQHNSKILSKDRDKTQRPCNCRIKESCPLNGKCLHQCMVYKAEVSTNATYKEYCGPSEGEFKSRYNNHTQSFRNISHINDTELSKCLWTLKANWADYHLKWSIKSYASRYKCGTRKCDLCLTEKMIIALADPKVLLNKRTELISKCRHRSKFILNSVK